MMIVIAMVMLNSDLLLAFGGLAIVKHNVCVYDREVGSNVEIFLLKKYVKEYIVKCHAECVN